LALRTDCPIFVDMEVIKASRNTMPTEEGEEGELQAAEEEWPDVIGEAGDLPM
jgi:bifunctional DNase/RNase